MSHGTSDLSFLAPGAVPGSDVAAQSPIADRQFRWLWAELCAAMTQDIVIIFQSSVRVVGRRPILECVARGSCIRQGIAITVWLVATNPATAAGRARETQRKCCPVNTLAVLQLARRDRDLCDVELN